MKMLLMGVCSVACRRAGSVGAATSAAGVAAAAVELAGAPLADEAGGSNIASAPSVVYQQQQFGDTVTDSGTDRVR